MNAKALIVTITLLLILPIGTAIEITSPDEEVAVTSTPTTVELSWQADASLYNVTLTGAGQTYLNKTTSSQEEIVSLQEGQYTLHVQTNNASANKTFSVIEETPLSLSVVTDKAEYTTSEIVRITAGSNQPTTASLTIRKDNEVAQTWDSLSISDSLNLMYPLENEGVYIATLRSGQSTASASWRVEQTQELEADFSYSTPILNKKTTFEADVTGGEAPYEYEWSFSDDTTTQQGEETDHYFLELGEFQVTLTATDARGQRITKTQTITVTQGQYTLDITLLSPENEPVANMTVQITSPEGTIQQQTTTINAAMVTFEDLVMGEYAVLVKDQEQTYIQETITIDEDTSKLYRIQREENTTQEQPQEEPVAQEPPTEEAQVQEIQITQQEIQQQQLEEQKAQAREELQQRELSFKLDSSKDEVLRHLDYYTTITQAINRISQASTQEEIQTHTNSVPTAVDVRNSVQTEIQLNEETLQEALTEYFQAQAITDEDEQEAYLYSVRKHHENVSVLETTYLADITTNGKKTTHSFIKKQISAPQESQYVEIISTQFASNAGQIQSKQRYEVLRDNPILRFNENEYLYSAQTTSQAPSTTIIIPETIQDPPGALNAITGMVNIDIQEGDGKKAILYIIIIMFSVAGVSVGKRMYAPSTGNVDAFCELAGEALDELQNGNAHVVAQITPDIVELHKQLEKAEQEQSQEIVDHLQEEINKHHFKESLKHVYAIGEHADINTLSAAYEETLHIYEQLNQSTQEQLQTTIQELESYLDKHIHE